MQKIIEIGNATAIITTSKDISRCDHEWSKAIVTFHNHEEPMDQEEYLSLPDDDKEQLHVSGGCAVCSKCNRAYWEIHNPSYLN
jgi:hypothetical protein